MILLRLTGCQEAQPKIKVGRFQPFVIPFGLTSALHEWNVNSFNPCSSPLCQPLPYPACQLRIGGAGNVLLLHRGVHHLM